MPGLVMGFMMGSGAGEGFSIIPDWSTYALLCQWESMDKMLSFFENHAVNHRLLQVSDESWTVAMAFTKGHGTWYGNEPFEPQVTYNPGSKIAIITRATIRPSKALDFYRNVPRVSRSVSHANGRLFSKGIGEWPLLQQATFSVWQNEEAVNEFAYAQRTQHAAIVKKTHDAKWYKEELFARFHILASWGNWNGINPLNPLLD